MSLKGLDDAGHCIAPANRYFVRNEPGKMEACPVSSVSIDFERDVDYRSIIPVLAMSEQEAVGVAYQFVAGVRDNLEQVYLDSCHFVARDEVIQIFRATRPEDVSSAYHDRLNLIPGRWYAAELIGDEFDDDKTSYTPIKINGVYPKGSGKGLLEIDFYHANYPGGVNGKRYRLKVVVHGRTFLLAKSVDHDPVRVLQVYEISSAWLKRHFNLDCEGSDGIDQWLDRNT